MKLFTVLRNVGHGKRLITVFGNVGNGKRLISVFGNVTGTSAISNFPLAVSTNSFSKTTRVRCAYIH